MVETKTIKVYETPPPEKRQRIEELLDRRERIDSEGFLKRAHSSCSPSWTPLTRKSNRPSKRPMSSSGNATELTTT
jgi:hypothetical protein